MSMADGTIDTAPISDEPLEHRPIQDVRARTRTRAPERRREAVLLFGPLLVLVLVHVALAMTRDRPLIFADEAGYLGNARFLAGGLPIQLFKSGAYYPGYSLLIAPLFWLGLTPEQTYRAILLANGLLLSSVYVSLVYWMRRILNDASKYAYAIAFVASLYPAFLVQPLFAMSESAVMALASVLPLSLHALLENKRATTAALFGAMVALLHLVHPRYVGTVAVIAIGLPALSLVRVLPWRASLTGLSTAGAGMLAGRWLTHYVTQANLGNAVSEGGRLAALGSLERIGRLLIEVVGQIWYLAAASAGLVILGVVALAWQAVQPTPVIPRRQSPSWNAVVFTLVSAVLAFGVSCLFLYTGKRVDHFIYGRYNEGLIAPFIATGLWSLVHAGRSWRAELGRLALILVTTVAFAVLLVWARGEAWLQQPNYANILAIVPQMKLFSGTRLLGVAAFAAGAYLVLALVRRLRAWLAIVSLALLFAWVTHHSLRTFLAMQEGRSARQVLFDRVATMPNLEGISYDATHFDPVTVFFGQYFLPNTRFDFFDGSKGQLPKTSFVLSRENWPRQRAQPGELLGKDKSGWSLWRMQDCCSTSALSAQNFGATSIPGISEQGFYASEEWPAGLVRWTNGSASLQIPVSKGELATSNLFMDIVSVGPRANRVVITANGHQLFSGKLARGRSRVALSLENTPEATSLDLRISSKTFVPNESGQSTDTRELGIAIRSLRLVRECCLAQGMPPPLDSPLTSPMPPSVPAE
jgi:hypothetical protein